MACNSRCQNAKGTRCDCECGGKNHGAAVQMTLPFIGPIETEDNGDEAVSKLETENFIPHNCVRGKENSQETGVE